MTVEKGSDVFAQATIERVLHLIGTEGKDVRKGSWNPKEVSYLGSCMAILSCMMRKSDMLDLTQLVEAGVTPQYAHEIKSYSDSSFLGRPSKMCLD